jgi:hypothetical protein
MHSPITIRLEEPVQAWENKVSELVLEPPTGRAILQAGYPFSTVIEAHTGNRRQIVDMAAMRLLIAHCAKVPESTIDALQAVDIYQAVEAMKIFFHRTASGNSSSESSSPENGAATKASSGASTSGNSPSSKARSAA